MTAAYRLVALHGFLGRPSDWNGLANWFPEASFSTVDLWTMLDAPDVSDWASMAQALNRTLSDALRGEDRCPAFLIAYSFGARLALSSTILTSPGSPLRGSCLVSCNPGLPDGDQDARQARRASDEDWERRILSLPEDEVWRAWDTQPVFGEATAPWPRGGLPTSRDGLARALRTFSLAGQPDYRSRLRDWATPLLWMTGARDAKFSAIARELSAAGVPATFVECEDAGHRVPWDNPSAFARAVRAWIVSVMET